MRQRARYAALIVLVALGAVPVRPLPAAAAPAPCSPPQPAPGITGQPWAQQRWGFDRLAALGIDGTGVTVAVIDSGVDAKHPQLRGAVIDGWDAFDRAGNGQQDCMGHGTAVASLIAGQPTGGTPFRGLAPGVKILPIRASERTDGNPTGRGTAADVAQAIREAVKRRAKVINLSLVITEDRPDVRAAVAEAVDKDVVVVAAVGNAHRPDSLRDPTPYPAGYDYDGVIGVGALDETGARVASSQAGPYVDLVAPGGHIQAAVPGNGYQLFDGTSMATPLVSAAAALVIQSHQPISARQVAARLMATADPAPGAPGSPEYGSGVLNPYRAVVDAVASRPPTGLAPIPAPRRDPAAGAAAAAAAQRRTIALSMAGGVGLLAVLVVLIAEVVPRGRRRGWQPGTGRVG